MTLNRQAKIEFINRRKKINFIKQTVAWICPISIALIVGLVPVLVDKEANTFLKKFSKFIENAESIVIVGGVVKWLMESGDRQEKKHYEAWQVIDNAASAKVSTSYARITALQDLNEDSVSLKGLDLPGADLSSIDLQGADLSEADLSEADLSEANLSFAYLGFVNLTGADLSGANLTGTILVHSTLIGADLRFTDLSNAILLGANLREVTFFRTNLTKTCLALADLSDAVIGETNLKEADLDSATLPDGSLYQSPDQLKRYI
jgi:uncharacterized protein YjbI with pentapeptide repeats